MIQLPRITVITPSLNQGEFIERTILSVLDQGYPNLEYIVVDGASDDDTVNILKKYGDRLAWISESDRGQSHAINKGIRLATGDVIAFLNSDDLYLPGALLAVGYFFARQTKASWVTGRCRIIDQNDEEIRKGITFYKNMWLRFAGYHTLHITNYVSQMATFWRREVIEQIGELDESLHYVMDYDYWLRIIKRYKLYTLNQYLACFRVHTSSKSSHSASGSVDKANKQFDEEFQVVRRHSPSPLFTNLHRLHNAAIVAVYRQSHRGFSNS